MRLVTLTALTALVACSTLILAAPQKVSRIHNLLTLSQRRLSLANLLQQISREDKHTISIQNKDDSNHRPSSKYQVVSQRQSRGDFNTPEAEMANKVLTSQAMQEDRSNKNKDGTGQTVWDSIFNFKDKPKTMKRKEKMMATLQNIKMKLRQLESEQHGPKPRTQYISFLVRKLLPPYSVSRTHYPSIT